MKFSRMRLPTPIFSLLLSALSGLLPSTAALAQTSLQDPTRPVHWPAAAGATTTLPTLSDQVIRDAPQAPPLALNRPEPSGQVQVLVLHAEHPFAIVDGQVVRPGERLGDWRVTGIFEHGVGLRRHGKNRALSPTPALVKTMRPVHFDGWSASPILLDPAPSLASLPSPPQPLQPPEPAATQLRRSP